VADAGATGALRSPSAILAIATVVVVAWWMRRRSWFGVAVTAAVAIDPFLVLHGRQARMYVLLAFLGVVAAWAGDEWSSGPRPRRFRWLASLALLLGLFTHVSALALGLGLLLLAGRRTDREAWRWRVWLAGAGLAWAVAWGPRFLDQAGRNTGSWIPTTSLDGLDAALSGLVVPFHRAPVLVVGVVVAGAWALRGLDRGLARVWWCIVPIPVLAVALVGLEARILLPRTLAVFAWAAPIGVVAALVWVLRRSRLIGVALVALALLVAGRSVQLAVEFEEDTGDAMRSLSAAVGPGDVVVVHPEWMWPTAWWALGGVDPEAPPDPFEPSDARAFVVGGASSTGRTWLVQPDTYGLTAPPSWPRCAEAEVTPVRGWRLECRVAPPP
jgi:hypothetical protein